MHALVHCGAAELWSNNGRVEQGTIPRQSYAYTCAMPRTVHHMQTPHQHLFDRIRRTHLRDTELEVEPSVLALGQWHQLQDSQATESTRGLSNVFCQLSEQVTVSQVLVPAFWPFTTFVRGSLDFFVCLFFFGGVVVELQLLCCYNNSLLMDGRKSKNREKEA